MENRVTSFEIPAANTAVSRKFYNDVFGWQYEQSGCDDYWIAISGDENSPGINGAIMKVIENGQPVCNTITVGNIDKIALRVQQAGGRIVKPKFEIPQCGWLAFFADPDGNCSGILEQNQPSAQKKYSQNKQTVLRYFEGIDTSDHEKILDCLTDDIVWEIPGALYITGKAGFNIHIRNDAFDVGPVVQVHRYTEEKDIIIAEGSIESKIKNGSLLSGRFSDVIELRDGNICHITTYIHIKQ